VSYNPEAPIEREPPFTARELGTFMFSDMTAIDTWLPTENRSNLYSLSRTMQRTINYSGIQGIETQDRAMTEGMGYVCDRSEEHLGSSDVAIIHMRRMMLRLIENLQKGIEPYAATHPELYRVQPLDVVSEFDELEKVLQEYRDQALIPA
jgi:hypothetical protein